MFLFIGSDGVSYTESMHIDLSNLPRRPDKSCESMPIKQWVRKYHTRRVKITKMYDMDTFKECWHPKHNWYLIIGVKKSCCLRLEVRPFYNG